MLFPNAQEDDLRLIITQFEDRSTAAGTHPSQRIYTELRAALHQAGIAEARLALASHVADAEPARRLGQEHRALYVIWGWFDDAGFRAHFTITLGLGPAWLRPPTDFSLYVRHGRPADRAAFSYLALGQVYFWDQRFQPALDAFDRAINAAQDSGNPQASLPAYLYRGFIQAVILRDLETALPDYEQAIALQPDSATAYHQRGVAWQSHEQYERAISDYDKAIELHPGFADAYLSRGHAYDSLGEPERTIADFDKAIENTLY